MKKMIFLSTILILFLSLALAACTQATPTTAPTKPADKEASQPTKAADQPADKPAVAAVDGKTAMESACTKCHSLDRITSKKKSADEWKATVERMIGKGASLNDSEKQAVIQYLAATYPK